jgi:multidrug efflux pump subunit AcrB
MSIRKSGPPGVSIDNAMSSLQTLMGSYYASNFIRFGQMYKVMVQADPRYRTKPEDVLTMRAKNDQGEMVPYANFVSLERVYGPEQLTRYNMYTSAMINGDAAPGYSSGDAIRAIQKWPKQHYPKDSATNGRVWRGRRFCRATRLYTYSRSVWYSCISC